MTGREVGSMSATSGEVARCRVVIGEQHGEPVECGGVEAIHGSALGMVGGHDFNAGEDAGERLVYVCDGCGAEHPQLWDLQHAEWCPPMTAWHVEGRQSGRTELTS